MLVASFVLALLCAACGRTHHDAAHGFQRPSASPNLAAFYDAGTVILDSLPLPAYFNGADAMLVTSRDTADAQSPAPANSFDRIELFARDPGEGTHVPVFVDPVDNGVAVAFRDVTGDGRNDVLVSTRAADGDSTMSRGLSVYGFTDAGQFTLLFQSNDGAPEVADVPGAKGAVIRVAGEYTGRFPGIGAVRYVRGVNTFNGAAFERNDSLTTAAATRRLEDFDTVMRGLQKRKSFAARDVDLIYQTAAGLLLQSEVIQKSSLPIAIWTRLRDFLQARLPRDKFQDLESLVNDESARLDKPSS